MTAPHARFTVRFDEDVGAVRRAVGRCAASAGNVRDGDAELVATELAANIVRHAPGGGYVLVRPVGAGVELLAVDHGDGRGAPTATPRWVSAWSLAASRGLQAGLATVAGASTAFDFYSAAGGTVVLARLGVDEPFTAGWCAWGGVSIARDGEGDCGDAWAAAPVGRGTVAALLVDGLGHGTPAAAASGAALASFARRPTDDLPALVERAHEAMRPTRGGVLGAAAIDRDREQVTFVGVGNVTACVVSDQGTSYLPSRDGIVGDHAPAPRGQPVTVAWRPGATLVLASDGVRARWDLRGYPGLLDHDPAVIAATLQRDNERGTDDVAVAVVHDLRDAR